MPLPHAAVRDRMATLTRMAFAYPQLASKIQQEHDDLRSLACVWQCSHTNLMAGEHAPNCSPLRHERQRVRNSLKAGDESGRGTIFFALLKHSCDAMAVIVSMRWGTTSWPQSVICTGGVCRVWTAVCGACAASGQGSPHAHVAWRGKAEAPTHTRSVFQVRRARMFQTPSRLLSLLWKGGRLDLALRINWQPAEACKRCAQGLRLGHARNANGKESMTREDKLEAATGGRRRDRRHGKTQGEHQSCTPWRRSAQKWRRPEAPTSLFPLVAVLTSPPTPRRPCASKPRAARLRGRPAPGPPACADPLCTASLRRLRRPNPPPPCTT